MIKSHIIVLFQSFDLIEHFAGGRRNKQTSSSFNGKSVVRMKAGEPQFPPYLHSFSPIRGKLAFSLDKL